MGSKVNVYENEFRDGPIIARVAYNDRLDYWDVRNRGNGGVGSHLGITRLRDGRYVLIHGTQWQGERDWAEVVTDKQALQAILRSGNDEVLELPLFAKLKELAADSLVPEAV
ncbi:hypothetical protein ACFOQM_06215 [Paenibacillus sp. GCM10012307]|uniref:Uncharacterized protein n=1 Tax=Paenibacillus roseus TaxID=2798579 RepID=A0A934MPH7_9BACL|nr:hypothetical protein [Paenibacillus roseus]MBJ6360893.1 hypothetical protein [Paenibacillus roseus]